MRFKDRPRRTRWLSWIVVAVAAATVAGYAAGSQVRSPQDALASLAAPDDSVLTATVDRGRISTAESYVGAVRWQSTRPVKVPGSDASVNAYVTETPLGSGDRVEAGSVLMTIADRPVFVLEGPVPMLRDLAPGDRGPDVARFQDGLRSAGYYSATSDGEFGPATSAALERLYEASGHTPPERVVAPEGLFDEEPGRQQEDQQEDQQGRVVERLAFAAAHEIVFVPQLPATLLSYPAGVGELAGDSVAELGVGELVVQVDVPTSWQGPLRKKGAARIQLRIGNDKSDGVVSEVGEPRVLEDRGELLPVTIRSPDARLHGTQVEVVLRERGAPAGLRVPMSALYTAADLGEFVRVVREGATARVAVGVVATGNGVAIIEPDVVDEVRVGDEVVVGVDRSDG